LRDREAIKKGKPDVKKKGKSRRADIQLNPKVLQFDPRGG